MILLGGQHFYGHMSAISGRDATSLTSEIHMTWSV